MGQIFQQALRRSRESAPLLDEQRLWLSEREKRCGAFGGNTFAACLLDMTKQRVAALSKELDIITDTGTAVSSPATAPIPTSLPTRSGAPSDSFAPKGELATSTKPQPNNLPKTAEDAGNSAIGILFAAVGLGILVVALRLLRKLRDQQRLAAAQKLLEAQREAAWQRLVGKYGEEIAARIVAHRVWQGMTVEQLIESWGSPADVDREIIKTRTKETWKYGQTGKNRFANRVYLENGIVIGWKI